MTFRQFTDVLPSLRYGTLNDDLGEALNTLTKKCDETNKSGTLTLTLKLKPGKGGQIEIFDEIKVSLPKEEKASSIMFATPDGNLIREDPRQMTIDGLRTLDKETGELRRVG